MHVWDLDLDLTLDIDRTHRGDGAAVHHATAKIVLVGNIGVGKTGLGSRLANGHFAPSESTHGQQFWVVDTLSRERDDGTKCEAVLSDLAGQPDYRLIHALFVDDADLALVLFDPTHDQDPLRGVSYWLKLLRAASNGDDRQLHADQRLCAE